MARCNKCGSGFIRDAPRGRRSILRAKNIYRLAPGGPDATSRQAHSRHLQTQSLWNPKVLGRTLRGLSVLASLPGKPTPSRLARSLKIQRPGVETRAFLSSDRFMAAVRGRLSGLPGSLFARFSTPRTAATLLCGNREVWWSTFSGHLNR